MIYIIQDFLLILIFSTYKPIILIVLYLYEDAYLIQE